jgi:hypothetical protein
VEVTHLSYVHVDQDKYLDRNFCILVPPFYKGGICLAAMPRNPPCTPFAKGGVKLVSGYLDVASLRCLRLRQDGRVGIDPVSRTQAERR